MTLPWKALARELRRRMAAERTRFAKNGEREWKALQRELQGRMTAERLGALQEAATTEPLLCPACRERVKAKRAGKKVKP